MAHIAEDEKVWQHEASAESDPLAVDTTASTCELDEAYCHDREEK